MSMEEKKYSEQKQYKMEADRQILQFRKFQRKEEWKTEKRNKMIFAGLLECDVGTFIENCQLDEELQDEFDRLIEEKKKEFSNS